MPVLMDLADVAEKTLKQRNVWRKVGEVMVRSQPARVRTEVSSDFFVSKIR